MRERRSMTTVFAEFFPRWAHIFRVATVVFWGTGCIPNAGLPSMALSCLILIRNVSVDILLARCNHQATTNNNNNSSNNNNNQFP